jgi:hypothetical protein
MLERYSNWKLTLTDARMVNCPGAIVDSSAPSGALSRLLKLLAAN